MTTHNYNHSNTNIHDYEHKSTTQNKYWDIYLQPQASSVQDIS